jgi:hypothetical protein
MAVVGGIVLLAGQTAPAADLLPSRFGAWSGQAGEQPLEQGRAAWEQTVLAEYGTTGMEHKVYTSTGQTLSIAVTRFKDPSGAFGAFTYFRPPRTEPAGIGDFSAAEAGHVLFLVGNLLADVRGAPTDVRELLPLAESLKKVADRRPYPELPSRLPEKGLQAGSECYVLGPIALGRFVSLGVGDWAGFGMGAEAQVAQYRSGGERATLLLLDYPTPQIAYNKLAEISRWFPVNPTVGRARGGVIYAKRNGSLLGLVTESSSAAYAQQLLDAIPYEVQVTWSERKAKLTEPTFVELIYSIFVLTGIILLVMLGAGIGFGGFRLIVKHFFPGRFFDRADRLEIIQLGLSRKTESLYEE